MMCMPSLRVELVCSECTMTEAATVQAAVCVPKGLFVHCRVYGLKVMISFLHTTHWSFFFFVRLLFDGVHTTHWSFCKQDAFVTKGASMAPWTWVWRTKLNGAGRPLENDCKQASWNSSRKQKIMHHLRYAQTESWEPLLWTDHHEEGQSTHLAHEWQNTQTIQPTFLVGTLGLQTQFPLRSPPNSLKILHHHKAQSHSIEGWGKCMAHMRWRGVRG